MTHHLPRFITFTGADEHTDVARMLALSSRYPIEWGILFSPKRQGSGRYPPFETAWKFQAYSPALKLSAHLCGDYAHDTIEAGFLPLYRQDFDLSRFIKRCARVQINTTRPALNVGEVAEWGAGMGVRMIYQTRAAFPVDARVDWLFDASGGRGIEPAAWPTPEASGEALDTIRGYAGGLGPDNIEAAVAAIGEWDPNYYLDMESRVRDADDRFDLAKCDAVCRAVYGEGAL